MKIYMVEHQCGKFINQFQTLKFPASFLSDGERKVETEFFLTAETDATIHLSARGVDISLDDDPVFIRFKTLSGE